MHYINYENFKELCNTSTVLHNSQKTVLRDILHVQSLNAHKWLNHLAKPEVFGFLKMYYFLCISTHSRHSYTNYETGSEHCGALHYKLCALRQIYHLWTHQEPRCGGTLCAWGMGLKQTMVSPNENELFFNQQYANFIFIDPTLPTINI